MTYKLPHDLVKLSQVVTGAEEDPLVFRLLLSDVLRISHEQANVRAVGQLLNLTEQNVFAY